jgi:polysaccharide biosynthesis transport protein
MDFWRVTAILNKRKWFIVLSVLVGTALTYGATRLIGSKWLATVQFVSPQGSGLTLTSDAAAAEPGSEASMLAAKSQALIYTAIVKSRDVLEPALKDSLEQDRLPPDLLKNIEFVAVAPHLFQLQVTDTSIGRSEKLANALADHFIEVDHKVRTAQAQKTVDLLAAQMRDADNKLTKAHDKYDAYRSEHHIVATLSATLDTVLNRLREARQRHDDADQKLADAKARLAKAEGELAALPLTVPALAAPMQGTQGATDVKGLQEQLAQADRQLAEYHLRYTESMPIVQRAVAARAAIVARLKAAQDKGPNGAGGEQPNPARAPLQLQVQSLTQEIAGYQALNGTLDGNIADINKELDQYKGVDSPLGALAADVASQSESRSNLAARLRASRAQLDVTENMNPLTIMDRVSDFNPPVNTALGRSLRMVGIGALCSLIAMCGLVIGLDSLDRRVRSVKEAEIALPAPIIAAIPQPMGLVTYDSLARATEIHPQSIHSESYRFLGLRLLSPDLRHVRSLMMLSAKAEQGSTTTITNLGITLAQAGKRVIIVDANVRTSELHKVFGVKNEYGYTDLLERPDGASLARALQPTTVANLQIITSGPQPENPWEMFRSSAVSDVAEQLEAVADYVLYDTPSSVIFTDALNLAPVVHAAFLCVRALEQVTGAEERLVKQLEEAHVPVLGCVLTDVPTAVVEGFSNYLHYYGPAANTKALAAGDVIGEHGSVGDEGSWIQLPQGPEPLAEPTMEEAR